MKNIPIKHFPKHPKETATPADFVIFDVEDKLNGKDMLQEPHRHNFFFILVLIKGSGHHEIDFTPYAVEDHTVFIMRPGQVHQLTLKAGSTGYIVQLNHAFCQGLHKPSWHLLRKVSQVNFYSADAAGFPVIQEAMQNIFREYKDRAQGFEDVIKAHLTVFLTALIRLGNNKREPAGAAGLYAQERLEELSAHLEQHITTHKQVSHYAAMLNLSPYQLNAITKTILGKTCSELINETIILEAKRNLLATSNQVNQVAYQLGYEDASYFIRFFKKHTGYSPDAFRQKFQ